MENLEEVILGTSVRSSGTLCRGRFAPSPSGRMHLGNIYAALMSYLSVRSRGGTWILRIEDNDPQRSKQQFSDYIMEDLLWLGMKWDCEPYYQSQRDEIYSRYLVDLRSRGLIYVCHCTRAELLATRAPHASDGNVLYSGKCRPELPDYSLPLAGDTLRLRTDAGFVGKDLTDIRFNDDLKGEFRLDVSQCYGDFVVRRRDGAWAYQFAVTVDDALMGITEVVRGDDLLLSTVPQRYIASILGLSSPERYVHLPLLRNEVGQRLSKRDNSLSMEELRKYHSPEEVIAMICTAASLPLDKVLPYLSFGS